MLEQDDPTSEPRISLGNYGNENYNVSETTNEAITALESEIKPDKIAELMPFSTATECSLTYSLVVPLLIKFQFTDRISIPGLRLVHRETAQDGDEEDNHQDGELNDDENDEVEDSCICSIFAF